VGTEQKVTLSGGELTLRLIRPGPRGKVPGKCYVKGWVGPEAGQDVVVKKIIHPETIDGR
jgi:hypothetical protein